MDTTFENLTADTIDMIKAAKLDKEVECVIKMVSEGKRTLPREIHRSHLIDALSYLMMEFDVLKVQIKNLKKHENEAAEDKSFTCTKCDKKFGDKEELRMHGSVHTEDNPFACSKCDTKFSSEDEMKEHERDHTEEKPNEQKQFACSRCDKNFSKEAEMKAHEMTHTGEKPKKDICKFYKSGYCKFRHNCRYDHPKVCKDFEKFGYKEGGCKDKNCSKGLHLNVCKFFVRGECKREKCKWFHPKYLKKESQKKAPVCSPWMNGHNLPANLDANGNFMNTQSFLELAKKVDLLLQAFSLKTT